MQYKTPHKIDLEDRIVGPLTMKQFGFVFGGGLIDYLLFDAIFPTYGELAFIVAAAVPTLLALGLAFLKIQDQPLGNVIISSLLYWFRGQLFLWQRTADPQFVGKKVEKEQRQIYAPKAVSVSDLDRLASIIDQRGWSANEINQPQADQHISLYGRVVSAAEARPTYAEPK